MEVPQAETEAFPHSSLEKGSLSAGVECLDIDTALADQVRYS